MFTAIKRCPASVARIEPTVHVDDVLRAFPSWHAIRCAWAGLKRNRGTVFPTFGTFQKSSPFSFYALPPAVSIEGSQPCTGKREGSAPSPPGEYLVEHSARYSCFKRYIRTRALYTSCNWEVTQKGKACVFFSRTFKSSFHIGFSLKRKLAHHQESSNQHENNATTSKKRITSSGARLVTRSSSTGCAVRNMIRRQTSR